MIEEELNKLPYTITKNAPSYCHECHRVYEKRIQYRLQIELRPHCDGLRYFLYYNCLDLFNGNKEKYIGEYGGLGFKTIKEAVEDLKKCLKN